MSLSTDFPFETCPDCPEGVFTVFYEDLYTGNGHAVHIHRIICENRKLCERLKKC